jgi:hypothetical protein
MVTASRAAIQSLVGNRFLLRVIVASAALWVGVFQAGSAAGSGREAALSRAQPEARVESSAKFRIAELASSVGMKVDAKRRTLWVCTGRYGLLADTPRNDQSGPQNGDVLIHEVELRSNPE